MKTGFCQGVVAQCFTALVSTGPELEFNSGHKIVLLFLSTMSVYKLTIHSLSVLC